MESLRQADVLIEFVLLSIDLLIKLGRNTSIVVIIEILHNLLALLPQRFYPLPECCLNVVCILVVNEFEILSLDLTRVKVVDSVANASLIALLDPFIITFRVVLNLAIIILLREYLRVRADVLL